MQQLALSFEAEDVEPVCERRAVFFCDLPIHLKILYRGNKTIEHGRIHLVCQYNYFHLPIDWRDAYSKHGNLVALKHQWLNRKYRDSGETQHWLYGKPEMLKTIVVERRKWDNKNQRWIPEKTREEIEPGTAGVYGFGGIPYDPSIKSFWREWVKTHPVKKVRKPKSKSNA